MGKKKKKNKNKKKKRGGIMSSVFNNLRGYSNYDYNGYNNYTTYQPRKKQEVTDQYSTDKCILVGMKQTWLTDVFKKIQHKIGGDEFQIHAHAFTLDFNNIRLVFPIGLFSLPQTGSPGHVSYTLDDIVIYGNKIKDDCKKIITTIVSENPTLFRKLNPTFIFDCMSLHRHPGRFGFSSTDTSKTIEPASCIYRNLECTNKTQVDMVMYINSDNSVDVVVSEGKIVNVKPSDKDDNIPVGVYTHYPTICAYKKINPYTNVFYKFFQRNIGLTDHFNFITHKLSVDTNVEMFRQILELVDSIIESYTPCMLIDLTHYKSYTPVQTTTWKSPYGTHIPIEDTNISTDKDIVIEPELDDANLIIEEDDEERQAKNKSDYIKNQKAALKVYIERERLTDLDITRINTILGTKVKQITPNVYFINEPTDDQIDILIDVLLKKDGDRMNILRNGKYSTVVKTRFGYRRTY